MFVLLSSSYARVMKVQSDIVDSTHDACNPASIAFCSNGHCKEEMVSRVAHVQKQKNCISVYSLPVGTHCHLMLAASLLDNLSQSHSHLLLSCSQ